MTRVVTTGVAGSSGHVVSDLSVEIIDIPLMPGSSYTPIWGANSTPFAPNDGSTDGTADYFPPPTGFRFGIFVLGGADRAHEVENLDIEKAQGQVAAQLPGLLDVMEPDEPGMHTSQTIDCIYVLNGRVTLDLGNGNSVDLATGDAVVQNGTRHAWRNTADEQCILLIAVVGARPAS